MWLLIRFYPGIHFVCFSLFGNHVNRFEVLFEALSSVVYCSRNLLDWMRYTLWSGVMNFELRHCNLIGVDFGWFLDVCTLISLKRRSLSQEFVQPSVKALHCTLYSVQWNSSRQATLHPTLSGSFFKSIIPQQQ